MKEPSAASACSSFQPMSAPATPLALGFTAPIVPLAVSGILVISAGVVIALVLLWVLFRNEVHYEAEEHAHGHLVGEEEEEEAESEEDERAAH